MDECILDCLDLSRDNRQDRYVYSVELIKAAPGSTLAQTREYLTHSLVHSDDHRIDIEILRNEVQLYLLFKI